MDKRVAEDGQFHLANFCCRPHTLFSACMGLTEKSRSYIASLLASTRGTVIMLLCNGRLCAAYRLRKSLGRPAASSSSSGNRREKQKKLETGKEFQKVFYIFIYICIFPFFSILFYSFLFFSFLSFSSRLLYFFFSIVLCCAPSAAAILLVYVCFLFHSTILILIYIQ